MLTTKYQKRIKDIIIPILRDSSVDVFVFGTAARAVKFGDVDLAVVGRVSQQKIRQLKDALEESNLPYFFDVVALSRTSKSFKENILKNKIIWLIKH